MNERQWTQTDLIRLIAASFRRAQTYLQPKQAEAAAMRVPRQSLGSSLPRML
jgi:hypothetical protein